MFDNKRFITCGIDSSVPVWLQYFMWQSIDNMTVTAKDYLQVFNIYNHFCDGIRQQKIVHTQEEPFYKKEYFFNWDEISPDLKIFVIDDVTHSTMLLAEEY